MDYENGLAISIRKGDVNALKSLGITEKYANEKLTCPTPVPSSKVEFFLPEINYPTPLVYAIQCKQVDSVSFLLRHGAKIDQNPIMGWYPIHYAIASRSYEITDLILSLCSEEIKRQSSNGSTPLHFAVSSNDLRIVLLLLKYGADSNAPDNSKSTPLHLSVRCHNEEIILSLLAAGADLTSINSKKQTPEIIANEFNLPLFTKVMKNLGDNIIQVPKLEDLYRKNQVL